MQPKEPTDPGNANVPAASVPRGGRTEASPQGSEQAAP